MIIIKNKHHWLVEQAHLQANRTAVVYGENYYSYNNLLDLSLKAANFLQDNNIKKNKKVALITSNKIEFIITLNALWFIGAIPVLLNNKLSKEEILEQVDFLKLKSIIHFSHNKKNEIPERRNLICTINNFNRYTTKFRHSTFLLRHVAILMFTSGSTGKSKCVEFTFSNLFRSVKQMDSVVNQTIYDSWLALLPFYHIGGFSIITRSLIAGTQLVIPTSLNVKDIADSVRLNHPSLVSFVPILFERILKEIEKPWKNLRYVFIGGASAEKKIINKALKNIWPLYFVYGSTETASMVTMCTPENIIKNGISAGQALEDVMLEINPKNKLIKITSASVANGYVQTNGRKKLFNSTFVSSDIGEINDKNNLILLGRKDDIIISGGENISLKEIEAKLSQKFKKIKLIGVKDAKWGQSYIIVTDSKAKNIAGKILDFIKENFASFKKPQNIFVVNKIPYNEMGKIKFDSLKEKINADFL